LIIKKEKIYKTLDELNSQISDLNKELSPNSYIMRFYNFI